MRATQILAAIFLLPLAAGCTSFRGDWREAASRPVPPGEISGCWEGTWQNTSNAHRDKLRAILTRLGEGEYRAHFHAKYRKILSFSYEATFRGTWGGNQFVFHGEEDLGWLAGGVYRYDGHISPTNFFSTYDSRGYSGTFTLKRAESEGH